MSTKANLVSIHGGHSGQFCGHARDTLEDILHAYRQMGFAWVGVTEHMPPTHARFLYPEELRAGMSLGDVEARFQAYMIEARRLQAAFKPDLDVLVGFETEFTTGSADVIPRLIRFHRPDYVVGSVHHIDDIPFDTSPEAYAQAMRQAGGVEPLYCRYFDLQEEMMRAVKPAVVGHFDLVRIFDPQYATHLRLPSVWQRILRNLALAAGEGMILDFNVAALRKGAVEPYLSAPILAEARAMNLCVVPGDDSHSVDTVGAGLRKGIALLETMGFDTRWRRPDRPSIF